MQNSRPYILLEKILGRNTGNAYFAGSFLFILVLPLLSIVIEFLLTKATLDPGLIGKWFIFWSIGIRLFFTGIYQIINPEFKVSSKVITTGKENLLVIRELGLANISIGLIGIISVFNNEWRQVAAIAGVVFFGLTGIQHFLQKPGTNNEMVVMGIEIFMFSIILLYLLFTVFV